MLAGASFPVFAPGRAERLGWARSMRVGLRSSRTRRRSTTSAASAGRTARHCGSSSSVSTPSRVGSIDAELYVVLPTADLAAARFDRAEAIVEHD